MNTNELAKAMLRYSELSEELAEIGTVIETAVLALKKTQTVGNVTATYSGGRKTYDYETAAVESPLVDTVTIEKYTTTHTITDYTKLCKDLCIDAPFTQSSESVKIKVAKVAS